MAVLSSVLQQAIDGDKVSSSVGGNVIFSKTAVGLPRKRRRFSNRVDNLPVTMTMDLDLFNQFELFYKDDLRDGSLSFTMTHPVRGVSINASFTDKGYSYQSIGIRHYQVKFGLTVVDV